MPARDRLHRKVQRALIKDGWSITHDPLTLDFEGVHLFTDMGAEPGFAAEKQDLSIAIEVKSFFAESPIREFESTIGQYQIYRIILRSIDPERKLYLAVSDLAFKDFFQLPFAQKIMSELPMPMIVVDYFAEEVLQWIR